MKIALCALLTILLIGCGEKTITNTIYTPAETAKGNIVGQVALYDTAGKILLNQSGAIVALDNTSYSTTSDSSGFWTLHDVPAGTYTISFSKEGYSCSKNFNLSFNANGTLYYRFNPQSYPVFASANLYQILDGTPGLTLAPFQDQIPPRDSEYYDSLGNFHRDIVFDTIKNYYAVFRVSFGNTPLENLNRGVQVFFGKTDAVSASDPSTYSTGSTSAFEANLTYLGVRPLKTQLYSAGFSPGEKVYCVAYAGSTYSAIYGFYFDPKLKRNIFCGVGKGHSEIKSFICP